MPSATVPNRPAFLILGVLSGVIVAVLMSWHSAAFTPSGCVPIRPDADHATVPIPPSWDYDGRTGWWFGPRSERVGWSLYEDSIIYARPCPESPAYE